MRRVADHIRAHALEAVGYVERLPPPAELAATEWSSDFERYMRNRMIQGAFRYGRFDAEGKGQTDNCAGMIKRLALYLDTGNTEHLVDVANIAMIEFVHGVHPLKHFAALDDAAHHAEVKR